MTPSEKRVGEIVREAESDRPNANTRAMVYLADLKDILAALKASREVVEAAMKHNKPGPRTLAERSADEKSLRLACAALASTAWVEDSNLKTPDTATGAGEKPRHLPECKRKVWMLECAYCGTPEAIEAFLAACPAPARGRDEGE